MISIKPLQQTAAAMRVSRSSQFLSAAAAAELFRSATLLGCGRVKLPAWNGAILLTD
jgi:hypothetical protein